MPGFSWLYGPKPAPTTCPECGDPCDLIGPGAPYPGCAACRNDHEEGVDRRVRARVAARADDRSTLLDVLRRRRRAA